MDMPLQAVEQRERVLAKIGELETANKKIKEKVTF